MSDYQEFLQGKQIKAHTEGFEVAPNAINPMLFPYQRDIVMWALRRGRAALFADCGLGKTPMQVEWAHHVALHTGKPVLILAPLAVASQTAAEGAKFGRPVKLCREQADVEAGINVANYEMLHKFEPSAFGGIVLDESSILKAYDGEKKKQIIEAFSQTPYRLACTATPAPNDYLELANHSEFLGVMSRVHMLSSFFWHDGSETHTWLLKGHAEEPFWQWVASWAVMLRRPSDLGYSDEGFELPPLEYHAQVVEIDNDNYQAPDVEGQPFLFPVEAKTLQERRMAKATSLPDRIAAAAKLVNATPDQWVVWCNLNAESEALTKAIAGAVEVTGSMPNEDKEAALADFAAGCIRVLVTKPMIAGFGLNWQQCHQMAFVGLGDSFEQYYQAVRRCWRFGQQRKVDVHVITSSLEGAIVRNIERKEGDYNKMQQQMLKHMAVANREDVRQRGTHHDEQYNETVTTGEGWAAYLGDCVEGMKKLADNSIAYKLSSPPFAALFVYSNSLRDMGNSKDMREFMEHYRYCVRETYRVLMPGRLATVHCTNLQATKNTHGYIGIMDFRGDIIRLYEEEGFILHSEVVVWKDPVQDMQRTKALGLLYKQLKKDSTRSRMGIPDTLLTFVKPGDNLQPVTKDPDEFPVQMWQNYASPVWFDINRSDTLQKQSARDDKDERHICPLQLGVIERCIRLWTNPGDLVLDPFGGIGSTAYEALRLGRQAVTFELKPSYYRQLVGNLRVAETLKEMPTLFDLMPVEELEAVAAR